MTPPASPRAGPSLVKIAESLERLAEAHATDEADYYAEQYGLNQDDRDDLTSAAAALREADALREERDAARAEVERVDDAYNRCDAELRALRERYDRLADWHARAASVLETWQRWALAPRRATIGKSVLDETAALLTEAP